MGWPQKLNTLSGRMLWRIRVGELWIIVTSSAFVAGCRGCRARRRRSRSLLPPLIRNLRLQTPVVCAKVNTNGKAGGAARLEPSAGSVVQHHVEQRTVNPQSTAVVVDEAQVAELVHEEVDSCARGADDLRQHFLAHFGNQRLGFFGLPEVRQQEKHPRQPLLAGVEELV